MSGYTPGPWVVNTDYGFVMQQRTRRVVAEVDRMGFTGNKAHQKRTLPDLRLMAAAPDLLEALQNLLKVHKGEGGTTYHAGDIARAAIAKATGEAT